MKKIINNLKIQLYFKKRSIFKVITKDQLVFMNMTTILQKSTRYNLYENILNNKGIIMT